jgi:hypothetical protein
MGSKALLHCSCGSVRAMPSGDAVTRDGDDRPTGEKVSRLANMARALPELRVVSNIYLPLTP